MNNKFKLKNGFNFKIGKPVGLLSIFITLGSPLFATAVSAASEELFEEIIVTATRRAESLQDIPQSISALRGSTLEKMAATDFNDYVRSVPGVNFVQEMAGSTDISIRGVKAVGTSPKGGATVGYYIDETPLPTAFDFPEVRTYDIERVEILRGPQGTLFGEGSIGGTIRIINAKPDATQWSSGVELTRGNINEGGDTHSSNAMINIPLIEDSLALRVVGYTQDTGGFLDNPYLGEKNVNDYRSRGGRGMLQYDPTDSLSLLATAHMRNSSFGGRSQGNSDLQQASSVRGEGDDDYKMYNLTVTYELSGFELVSSSSYFDRDAPRVDDIGSLKNDPGVGFLSALLLTPPGPVDSVWTDNIQKFEMFSQEFRAVSTDDGPFQWTVGAFYKDSEKVNIIDSHIGGAEREVNSAARAIFFPGLTTDKLVLIKDNFELSQKAVFGEASYQFNDYWQVIAGIRVFEEKRDSFGSTEGLFLGSDEVSFTDSDRDNVVTPKLTINYTPSSDLLLYATAAEGFRSGGQNAFVAFFPGANKSFEPETLMSYEIGGKTNFGGRITLNGSIYYIDRKDMITGTASNGVINLYGNAGEAETFGVDWSLTARLTDGLEIGFGGAWIKGELGENEVPIAGGGFVPEGTQIPNIPKWGFSGHIQHVLAHESGLEIASRLDWTFTGESLSNIAPNNPVDMASGEQSTFIVPNPSYHLFNATIGISKDHWEVQLFAKNLADERALMRYFVADDSSLDPRGAIGGTTGLNYFVVQPRTIGLTLRYKM